MQVTTRTIVTDGTLSELSEARFKGQASAQVWHTWGDVNHFDSRLEGAKLLLQSGKQIATAAAAEVNLKGPALVAAGDQT